MNPGVERFLILGCIAILILEAPSLLGDLRFGDGSYAVLAAERPAPTVELLASEVAPEPPEALELAVEPEPEVLALAELPPELLPEQPGL